MGCPASGSPPHVRGKGCCHHPMILVNGITPACAGKRPAPPAQLPLLKDHPRVCGEKKIHEVFLTASGSPPHVRGKAVGGLGPEMPFRITPAHAGKSTIKERTAPRNRDHPRTCGEKGQKVLNQRYTTGSPPHMRGKGKEIPADGWSAGITPAHAGKRQDFCGNTLKIWDHPRTCGEKQFALSRFAVVLGSPPHMRGKGLRRFRDCIPVGITPAHAGKSKNAQGPADSCEDHPRTCGEKLTTFDAGKLIPGSPPHMRGKAASRDFQIWYLRITPAHAGKRSHERNGR